VIGSVVSGWVGARFGKGFKLLVSGYDEIAEDKGVPRPNWPVLSIGLGACGFPSIGGALELCLTLGWKIDSSAQHAP
jgi:hypothetical protein